MASVTWQGVTCPAATCLAATCPAGKRTTPSMRHVGQPAPVGVMVYVTPHSQQCSQNELDTTSRASSAAGGAPVDAASTPLQEVPLEAALRATQREWAADEGGPLPAEELHLHLVSYEEEDEAADMERERVKHSCPGRGLDGGMAIRRFERCYYDPLPDPETTSSAGTTRDLVIEACMMALRQKQSSPHASETSVRTFLENLRKAFQCEHASPSQRTAAPFLPASYKQVLCMLEDMTPLRWPPLWKYGACECGFIYRGVNAGASTCPARKPDTKATACAKARDPRKTITYSPIAGYIRRIYGNPATAKEFGEWQQRLDDTCKADPGGLHDIGDGNTITTGNRVWARLGRV